MFRSIRTKLGRKQSQQFCYKSTFKVDRTGTKVTVVQQKVKKDYSFHTNILELCVECLEKGVVPNPEVPTDALKFKIILYKLQFPIDEDLNRKRRHSFVKVTYYNNLLISLSPISG